MMAPALTGDSHGSYLVFSGGSLIADDDGRRPTRIRAGIVGSDEEVSGAGSGHPGWLQLGLGLGVGGYRSSSAAFSSRPIVGDCGRRGAAAADERTAPSSISPSILRVVGRPRRPQTGLWLVLRAASQEQHIRVKELNLPQIPKSYLRIKNGRMTVRLLMKYLANKLGLGDESQVEITCRGQQLPPFLTLTSVRDSIRCSPEAAEPQPADSPSSAKYVMNLSYRRSRNR